eukprot:TRINITY_DN57150_c0_g1_i1.p1 TRINITY_DN57150_c0_g1~~TRINITY_DN57150_c0_g1_i1.p1  ORF type:complete len:372 (-),score=98.01 TRINITY_DN57150_c0_g1_i1:85-1200(-)
MMSCRAVGLCFLLSIAHGVFGQSEVGLSLVQVNVRAATKRLLQPTKIAGLEGLNDTIASVEEALKLVNTTADGVAGSLSALVPELQGTLTKLSAAAKAAAAASKLMGGDGEELTSTVSFLVDQLNASVVDLSNAMPAALLQLSAQLDAILQQIAALVEKAYGQITDASSKVDALANMSVANSSVFRETDSKERRLKALLEYHKAHVDMRGATALQQRASETHGKVQPSNMDSSIAAKGGGGGTPCASASGDIAKANKTLGSIQEELDKINGTVLVESVAASAGSAIAQLNTTAMAALDQAASSEAAQKLVGPVKSSIASLLTKALKSVSDASVVPSAFQSALEKASSSLASAFDGVKELESKALEECASKL